MNLLDRLLSLGKSKPKLVVVPQPIRLVVLSIWDGIKGECLSIHINGSCVGLINIREFLSEFRCGRGYEFIDEYIYNSGINDSNITVGSVRVLIDMLREFGHKNEYNEALL
jgi:hypothetical protein